MKALKAWQKYMEKTLTFPFDAEVSGYQRKGPLQLGDRVSVKKISNVLNKCGKSKIPKERFVLNFEFRYWSLLRI
jgi:hypothetical protein